jgi:hypothetical protein
MWYWNTSELSSNSVQHIIISCKYMFIVFMEWQHFLMIYHYWSYCQLIVIPHIITLSLSSSLLKCYIYMTILVAILTLVFLQNSMKMSFFWVTSISLQWKISRFLKRIFDNSVAIATAMEWTAVVQFLIGARDFSLFQCLEWLWSGLLPKV